MRFLLRALTTALVLTAPVVAAHASPITYTVSGTMTGTIGSTTFTDALTTFTLVGDTTNIALDGGVLFNPGAATVTIAGFGTATLTDSIAAFFVPLPNSLYGAGIADLTAETSVGVRSAGLAGYDLSTFIGPITGDNISGVDGLVGTSAGDLDITEIGGSSTFTASAGVSAVPEPSSLALMGTGMLGFVGVVRRKINR